MKLKLTRKNALVSIIVYAVVLMLCAVTRVCAERSIPLSGTAVIKNVLSLRLVYNTGAAFSFLKDLPWLASILSVLVLLGVTAFLLMGRMNDACRYALTAVLAGGTDNLVSRLFLGAVTDMIKLEFISFPVFNFADVCVTLGAVVFACAYLTDRGDR